MRDKKKVVGKVERRWWKGATPSRRDVTEKTKAKGHLSWPCTPMLGVLRKEAVG